MVHVEKSSEESFHLQTLEIVDVGWSERLMIFSNRRARRYHPAITNSIVSQSLTSNVQPMDRRVGNIMKKRSVAWQTIKAPFCWEIDGSHFWIMEKKVFTIIASQFCFLSVIGDIDEKLEKLVSFLVGNKTKLLNLMQCYSKWGQQRQS